jgi:hypothetical protein
MSALEKEAKPSRLYKRAKINLSNSSRLLPFNCNHLPFGDIREVGGKCGEIKFTLKIRHNGMMEKIV